ncbi:MAG TPA: hypothetical protein DCZ69_11065 [Syntrophobacteraceae bacterium]|nr:hypothetical protein [Syntrophobacteraceae bacterium]
MKLPVLDSIATVVANSRRVMFHPQLLLPCISHWGHLLKTRSVWAHPCHFFDGTEESVRWIFVLDVLNHCFWPDEGHPAWAVRYQREDWSGYWGLAAALKRAMELGYPLTDPSYLATIPLGDLQKIFAGEGQLPLLGDRLRNLNEAGRVIQNHLGGDILHLVEEAGGSGVQLAIQLVSHFPSFRDEARYGGQPVYFWKRAQIFVADLYHAFSGRDWGAFEDVDQLTAFADYKLPQVLRHLGIISYCPDLEQRIDRRVLLLPGSEEEIEIRATTIYAVAALRRIFGEVGIHTSDMAIDQWLWQLGQMEEFRAKPYHRCRTLFY